MSDIRISSLLFFLHFEDKKYHKLSLFGIQLHLIWWHIAAPFVPIRNLMCLGYLESDLEHIDAQSVSMGMQYALVTRCPVVWQVPRPDNHIPCQSLIIIIVQVVSMRPTCATPRCSTPRSLSRTRSTEKTPYRSVEVDLSVKSIALLIIASDYVCTSSGSVHTSVMFLNK